MLKQGRRGRSTANTKIYLRVTLHVCFSNSGKMTTNITIGDHCNIMNSFNQTKNPCDHPEHREETNRSSAHAPEPTQTRNEANEQPPTRPRNDAQGPLQPSPRDADRVHRGTQHGPHDSGPSQPPERGSNVRDAGSQIRGLEYNDSVKYNGSSRIRGLSYPYSFGQHPASPGASSADSGVGTPLAILCDDDLRLQEQKNKTNSDETPKKSRTDAIQEADASAQTLDIDQFALDTSANLRQVNKCTSPMPSIAIKADYIHRHPLECRNLETTHADNPSQSIPTSSEDGSFVFHYTPGPDQDALTGSQVCRPRDLAAGSGARQHQGRSDASGKYENARPENQCRRTPQWNKGEENQEIRFHFRGVQETPRRQQPAQNQRSHDTAAYQRSRNVMFADHSDVTMPNVKRMTASYENMLKGKKNFKKHN